MSKIIIGEDEVESGILDYKIIEFIESIGGAKFEIEWCSDSPQILLEKLDKAIDLSAKQNIYQLWDDIQDGSCVWVSVPRECDVVLGEGMRTVSKEKLMYERMRVINSMELDAKREQKKMESVRLFLDISLTVDRLNRMVTVDEIVLFLGKMIKKC